MLHISICDDERIAVEKMQRIVENVLEQEQLPAKLETFENGEEFLQQYVIRDDELVILDLDMPIKNGIDVIQELEKIQRNEVVILVTAYDNLAIQSFSYGPFQIIRKERLEEDLTKAVSRFLKMRQRKQEVLEFQVKGEIIHTKVSDIVYFEKCQHHVYVHLRDQTVLCIRKNMKDFEKELAGSLSGQEKLLVLDLSGLEYISSSGLRQFLVLQKNIKEKGGTLTVKNLRAEIKDIFDLTGFTNIFTIV